MVVVSSACWCDMFIHANTLVKIIRRFFTEPFWVIEDAPICNAIVFRDLKQSGHAKYIIFVLLSFGFRICWVIHSRISAIQRSKVFKEKENFNSFSWRSDIYTCVSSAYNWYLTPYHCCARSPRGWVYIVKTRQPRTEHCDTPDNKNWTWITLKPFKYFTLQTKHVF